MPKCNFKLEKSMIEEEKPEDVRPMVLTDAIQVIECTWVRELDGADKDQPGELHGYEGPYHDLCCYVKHLCCDSTTIELILP